MPQDMKAPSVLLRPKTKPASEGQRISGETYLAALKAALAEGGFTDEMVIEWDGEMETDERILQTPLRVLDIDYHGQHKPERHRVESLARDIRPAPHLWWISHGGGAHLVYIDDHHFTAAELAACAAAHAKELDGWCAVEVLHRTRHPGSKRDGKEAGPVKNGGLESLEIAIAGILRGRRGCNDDERQAWLEDRGMDKGETFDHTYCPIDPLHESHSDKPVWVGEDGVYCHSCKARLGDGFRSFGFLCGVTDGESSPVYEAAAGFAHWDHARYVCRHAIDWLPEMLWPDLYSGLLKSIHVPEVAEKERIERVLERIGRVFWPFPYVRGCNGWLNADDLTIRQPVLAREDVGLLPAAQHVRHVPEDEKDDPKDPDYQLKRSPIAITGLIGNGTIKGYVPLAPSPGSPVFGVHNTVPSTDKGEIFVRPNRVRAGCEYVAPSKRMAVDKAWSVMDRLFPGISHSYLTLLHVARGCAESGYGMVPMILVQGPTGSGKTQTVAVEATMAGDTVDPIDPTSSRGIVDAVGEKAQTSRAIAINEFNKAYKATHRRIAAAVLGIDRRLTFRQLYVGNPTVPFRSYVVMTDREYDEALITDEQFGRRVVYVKFTDKVQWSPETADVNSWCSTKEARDAANAIHSHIVDNYFPAESVPSFEALAKRVGFTLLSRRDLDSEEGRERCSAARALYAEVCKAHRELEPVKDAKSGRGWIHLNFKVPETATSLAALRLIEAYGLSDPEEDKFDQQGKQYGHLLEAVGRCLGDWPKLLGLPYKVECELHQKKGIRFREAGVDRDYRVNAELLPKGLSIADLAGKWRD